MSSRPFEQIVVHVGQPKTGTSHIQGAMVSNTETLLAHGIFYPMTRPEMLAHHCLVRSHYSENDGILQGTLLGEPGDDELVMAALKAQTGAKIAVLSSELMVSHFESHTDQMRALDNRLSELADRVRYVAYVRAPESRFPSICSQTLMRSALLPRQDWAMKASPLVKLHEMVGSRLDVRVYDRAAFLNGDVLQDFLIGAVGANVPAADMPTRRGGSNFSLSSEAMYLVQSIAMARQLASPESFPAHDAEMVDMVRIIRRFDLAREGYRSAKLLPGVAEVIKSRAAAELALLRDTFGIDLGVGAAEASVSDDLHFLSRSWVRNVFHVDAKHTALLSDDIRANPRCPDVLRDALDRVLMPGV